MDTPFKNNISSNYNCFKQITSFIDFLPDGTFAIDNDGKIIAWNKAMEGLLNMQQEKILGKTFQEYSFVFYNEARPLLINLLLQGDDDIKKYYPNYTKKDQTISAEAYVPKAYRGKGGYFWFASSPILDDDGIKIGAFETIKDITYIKEKAKIIEKYQMLFQNSRDVILFMNDEGEIKDANHLAERIYGYKKDELIKMNINQLMESGAKEMVQRQLGIANKEGVLFKARQITKGGKFFPAEVIFQDIRINGERIIISIIRDMTLLEEKQRELTKLAQVARQSPTSVVITDLDGNIEYVNSKFTEVTGYSFEEALGKNPRILKSGNQPQEVYDKLWKTILEGNR